MDTVGEKTRSRIMASVRQRNTRPEKILRRILHQIGLRYRLHNRRLPGTPDLTFPRFRVVIFVNGCFWHVHDGCRFATMPSSRKEFWTSKFKANQERDKRNYSKLAAMGMRVLIVWECALKGFDEDSLLKLGLEIKHWMSRLDEPYKEIGRES